MKVVAVSMLLLLCSTFGFADEYHYVDIFVGDRAAGMAGAYTAIADGPEGAYYNPAGLAFSSSAYISVSTNALQIKEITYNDVQPFIGIETNPVDYTRRSFAFVPNFFGFLQRSDNGPTFAFTLASTDNEGFDQRNRLNFDLSNPDLSIDTIILNTNFTNTRSQNEAGPSLAWLLGERFSLGFGLFAVYEDNRFITQNINRADADGSAAEFFTVTSRYFRSQIVSAKPQLGVQFMPIPELSIGYATNFRVPLYGAYAVQSASFSYDNTNNDFDFSVTPPAVQDNVVSQLNLFTNGIFEATEWRHSLGVAWFVSRALVISADARVYIPIADSAGDTGTVFTWNAAAGAEWYLSPNFPLRFGLFTNHSNQPSLREYDSRDTSTFTQNDHVDYYGASLSIGYTTADSSINLGLSGSLGFGQSQIVALGPLQDVTAFTMSVFISGGYQF